MAEEPKSGTAGQAERILDAKIAAFDLRKQGYTYRQIAVVLAEKLKKPKPFSPKTIWKYVQQEIGRRQGILAESREAIIVLELERLDRYLTKLEKRISTGDPTAVKAAIAIGVRRSHLLGLDAPKKFDINDHRRPDEERGDDEIDQELTAVRQQLASAAARTAKGSKAVN